MHRKSKSYFIQKFPTNFDKIFNLFFIEKKQILEYNKSIKDSWDVRHPTILNLHLCSWDSHIADLNARPPLAVEGRRAVADTHLALLGVKIVGNGILGITEENVYGTRKIFRVQKILKIQKRTYAKDK